MSGPATYRDSGWAFVVALAGFADAALSLGLFRSLGVLLVELIKHFESSTAQASVLFTCWGISCVVSAVFMSTALGGIVHERALVVTASVIGCIGCIVAFLSTRLQLTTICLGICLGVSGPVSIASCLSITARYFEKRISVASAFVVSGASCGIFVWPVLMQYLIDEYGYRGACLIFGGILLNGVVCAALMRPVPGTLIAERRDHIFKMKVSKAPIIPVSETITRRECRQNSPSVVESQNYEDGVVLRAMNLLENDQSAIKCTFDSDKQMISKKDGKTDGSKTEALDARILDRRWISNSVKRFVMIKPTSRTEKRTLKSIFGISLVKNPIFILFNLFVLLIGVVNDYLLLFYPAFTHDVGFTEYQSAFLLSTIGIGGIIGRFFFGFVGDCVTRRYVVVAITQAIQGLAVLLSPIAMTFWSQLIFAVTFGLVYGVPYSCRTVLIRDFFGDTDMPKIIGFTSLMGGLSSIISPPLFGFMRDITGDYSAATYTSVTILLTNSLLVVSMSIVPKLTGKWGPKVDTQT